MKLNSEACIYTLSLCIVFSYDLIASKLLCIYYRRREIISIILYYVYIIGTEIIVVLYCISVCMYYRRREIILELIHMSYYLILESLYTLTGLVGEEMYRPLHTTPKLSHCYTTRTEINLPQ